MSRLALVLAGLLVAGCAARRVEVDPYSCWVIDRCGNICCRSEGIEHEGKKTWGAICTLHGCLDGGSLVPGCDARKEN